MTQGIKCEILRGIFAPPFFLHLLCERDSFSLMNGKLLTSWRKMSYNAKAATVFFFVLAACFLSGVLAENMKAGQRERQRKAPPVAQHVAADQARAERKRKAREEARREEERAQHEAFLESSYIRYCNNGAAMGVLGTAAVCLDRCHLHGKGLTYSMNTHDGKFAVTITFSQLNDDIYNSASAEIWGARYDNLLTSNRQILRALQGRKFDEFRHLKAQATELPFGGKIDLECGGVITVKRISE